MDGVSFLLVFADRQEEDELPDDETINQMLARTELEYEKFQVSSLEISFLIHSLCHAILPLDEASSSRVAVFIVSRFDGRGDGWKRKLARKVTQKR